MGGKKEKVFELVLEIGHKASLLSKKQSNGYTHKWTVFVKGHNSSKIEHCISKVVFQLHESFANPSREITEPPFRIEETGYAGFEIPIQVYFKNREKPNHVVFVHDLVLLANKPNDSKTVEKIKFINPNKEFEKCLIRSGAQLLQVASKKERSNSPPAKKHKSSSSLIPSKDIDNKSQPNATSAQQQSHQQQQQQQSVPSSQHKQSSHSNHNRHSSNSHTNNSNSGSSSSNHHNHNHINNSHHNDQPQQHHQKHHHQHHRHHHDHNHHHHNNQSQSQQQQQQTQKQQANSQKPKSSKEFIDIFGAPLVAYRNKSKEKETHSHARVKQELPPSPAAPASIVPSVPTPPAPALAPPVVVHKVEKRPSPAPPVASAKPAKATIPIPVQVNDDPPLTRLQLLQKKLSTLSDVDRLQRIVDIIEEAGENFQLTSKKFQFDLKSLDKNTIYKIEKTLQNK